MMVSLVAERSSTAWLHPLLLVCGVLLADHHRGALALNVTDLGHLRWTLTNVPEELAHPHLREQQNSFPFIHVADDVTLPGSVHGALRDAGVLPQDPLIGFNEQTYRWVALSNWTYSTTLDISPATLADAEDGALDLILEGVDTFCDVSLNGVVLATLDNSFFRHLVPLNAPRSPLRAGHNTLRLRFTSALTAAAAAAAAYPYPVPDNSQLVACKTWPCPPGAGDVVGALPHYNFARKGASDSGWDWGPAFSPVGVYAAPRLVAHASMFLTDVVVSHVLNADGSGALLAVRSVFSVAPAPPPRLRRPPPAADAVAVCVSYDVEGVALPPNASRAVVRAARGSQPAEPLGGAAREVSHDHYLWIPSPLRLWWPRGYGPQHMYNVTVTAVPCYGGEGEGKGEGAEGGVRLRLKRERRKLAPSSETWTGGEGEGEEGRGRGTFSTHDDETTTTLTTMTITRRIGLRHVELIDRSEHDQSPATYHLRVNGSPVFVKGANMIPVDAFHGHGGGSGGGGGGGSPAAAAAAATTERLLMAAISANMNAVRVWGGGRYQSDAFYSRCDELGVLVWQESMFACAMYPRDDRFLASVRAETIFQARRLASHPSVAVWGGNNENEAALGWYKETTANPTLYAVDLATVFVDTLRAALLSALPRVDNPRTTFAFVDTSPSNGLVSPSSSDSRHGDEPYVKAWGDVSDPSRGDVHFYNYDDDCEDEDIFPAARFVSEFGFQSHPSLPTYLGALPKTKGGEGGANGGGGGGGQGQGQGGGSGEGVGEGHLVNGSAFLSFRQRHPGGDAQMLRQLRRRFNVPSYPRGGGARGTQGEHYGRTVRGGGASAPLPFVDYVYLTQVQQARCYDTAIRKWRRGAGGSGAARGTMGVLYWQLNDVWAGPTWWGEEERKGKGRK